MTQYYYQDIALGTTIDCTRTFCEQDVLSFAKLTKDNNPIHIDKEFAKNTIFQRQVVHGQLAASTFSMMFGTKCPGNGAIYCSQNTIFTAPIFLDEEVLFQIKAIDKNDDNAKITFETTAYKKSMLVMKGHAILKVQRRI